jgi:hypothetical protein
MRRIGEKPLLHRARVTHLAQEPVEGLTTGAISTAAVADSGRRSRGGAHQLETQLFQRPEAVGDAEPCKRGRGNRDEKRGHEFGHENFPDQPVALVQRFSDLHHVAARCAVRGDADVLPVVHAIEE